MFSSAGSLALISSKYLGIPPVTANTLSFLDDRLRLVSEELNGTEQNLQRFKTKEGITSLDAEGTLFLNQVTPFPGPLSAQAPGLA